MNCKSHRIKVLDREINVRTTADGDTVRDIEFFVNRRLAEVEDTGKTGDKELAAILTLMNIAEDYLALEKKIKLSSNLENERIFRLMQLVDTRV